jgi:hypothetical protein
MLRLENSQLDKSFPSLSLAADYFSGDSVSFSEQVTAGETDRDSLSSLVLRPVLNTALAYDWSDSGEG